ncbi:MAG: hypothetical protein Q6359_00250 [Candidatus Brocadiales bacterium]|nr:hypothetical protein [Candidatus Brocadiales bacterium]
MGRLLPELYLHGPSLGDFDLAPRGLPGDGAPLSHGNIMRLKAVWMARSRRVGGGYIQNPLRPTNNAP